jgi:hypothetical protein
MNTTEHWIPKDKPHFDTEKWWCESCQAMTPVEKNPEWESDGCPDRFFKEYPWFVRCQQCQSRHHQLSEFGCPQCGCIPDNDDGEAYDLVIHKHEVYEDRHGCKLIKVSEPRYNASVAMQYGGNPVDWEETWICGCCGEEFAIVNANY